MQIKEYTIGLRSIHLFAHHGVMQQEREIGAWFTIDIELTMNNGECTANDNIEETVSYADVYEVVKEEMSTPSYLLEHVCHRISRLLYEKFSQIEGIAITLSKDTPPMGGDRLAATVTLKSKR